MAIAGGYASATYTEGEEDFVAALRSTHESSPGPPFIQLKIGAGSNDGLGRPGIRPPEVARRFRLALT